MIINEQVFKSKKDISYVFYPQKDSKYLVIVFSGYSIHPEKKAIYNYMRSIQDINVNKLFILDNYGYDQRGCWYLGENLDFNVEYSVKELISHIQTEYNIEYRNIITCGSSKGGFASVYYGIKYKFGHVIVGAPQILLYNYISKFENILKSMENSKYDTKSILNNIIIDLDICNYTRFYIYCGKKDAHLKEHVMYLLNKIDKDKNFIYLELLNCDHSNIGNIFSEKIKRDINLIIDENPIYSDKNKINTLLKMSEIKDIKAINDEYIIDNLTINETEKNIEINIDMINYNFKYGIVATNNKGEVVKEGYYDSNLFNIKTKYNEVYNIKYLIKDSKNYFKIIEFKSDNLNDKQISINSIDQLDLSVKYYTLEFKFDKYLKKITLNVKKNSYIDMYNYLEFAYYLIKDNETYKVTWYSLNNNISYDLKEDGIYNIKVFIKKDNNEVISMNTEKIDFKN